MLIFKPIKMKRTLLTLASLAILTINSIAQSVDIDRFYLPSSIRNFPEVVDLTKNTYNVTSPTGNDVSDDFSIRFASADNIQIEGLKKVTKGHYDIRIIFVDARIDSYDVEEIKRENKDKNGVLISTAITYQPVLKYTIKFKSEIYDYTGKFIATALLTDIKIKSTKLGGEHAEWSKANAYMRNNRRSILNEFFNTEYTNHVNATQAALNNKLGWTIASGNTPIWILDSKKHPEYEKQQAISAEVKAWAMGINATTPLTEEQIKKAEEFLAYFESLKTKYSSDKRPDRKMRYSAYFNKAVIYNTYLDSPEKAMIEAQGLIANDYDKSDGRIFNEEAMKLKGNMDRAKIKSTHFPIDTDSFKGPGE